MTTKRELEERLERLFEVLVKYKAAHDGNTPTYREIAAALGLKSVGHIAWMLQKLAEQGRVRLSPFKSRNIEIMGARWIPPAQEVTS